MLKRTLQELVENIDQEAKVNEESENWWKLGMGANQPDAEEERREREEEEEPMGGRLGGAQVRRDIQRV